MPYVFLIFIIMPIIEITLLINVGQMIGVWYTLGLVLLSAFIGVNMLRFQSINTLTRARARMHDGEIPGQEMGEGIILAVGGALLVTPGFVTDVIGFCCLVPFTRQWIVKQASRHVHLMQPTAQAHSFDRKESAFQQAKDRARQGDTLEGEFTKTDEK